MVYKWLTDINGEGRWVISPGKHKIMPHFKYPGAEPKVHKTLSLAYSPFPPCVSRMTLQVANILHGLSRLTEVTSALFEQALL